MTKPIDDIVRNAEIFRSVCVDCIAPVISRSPIREFRRGTSIHLQGERAHSLYIVLDGCVKLYRMSSMGNEAVIAVLTRGDAFGEIAVLPDEAYTTGAECVTQARLLQIDARDLAQAIECDTRLAQSLLAASLKRQVALVHQLEQLKSQSSVQRIGDFLLRLCKNEVGTCTVVLPYDKVLIAAWLGMKPESLSRSFRRLQTCGVRVVKDRAIIGSVDRLRDFVEADREQSAARSA